MKHKTPDQQPIPIGTENDIHVFCRFSYNKYSELQS